MKRICKRHRKAKCSTCSYSSSSFAFIEVPDSYVESTYDSYTSHGDTSPTYDSGSSSYDSGGSSYDSSASGF